MEKIVTSYHDAKYNIAVPDKLNNSSIGNNKEVIKW